MLIRHILELLFLINIQDEITPGLEKAFNILIQSTKRYFLVQRQKEYLHGYRMISSIETAFEKRKQIPGKQSIKTVNQLIKILFHSVYPHLEEVIQF